MHHSQTSKRCSVAPQQHSQLWPFNMLRLRFIPLHLLLSQKMLTNLSNHFCNVLLHYCTPHHLPRFAAQCECLFAQTGLLSIHLLLPTCPHVAVKLDLCRVGLCGCQLGATVGVVENQSLLPFYMVQVPWHSQPSNGVEFPIVHQAVVSAASHSHPGHQVPVIQQRHVAPNVSHHHPRLCTTWKRENVGWLQDVSSKGILPGYQEALGSWCTRIQVETQ